MTTAFVIDDSAVVRTALTGVLTAAGIEVLGSASDPLFAWPRLQARWPDVIVLDVEMPRMDGLSFLKRLMAERPTPVVMCSTLTEKGCETTLEALALGAVGFVTKPTEGLKAFLQSGGNGLAAMVKGAAGAKLAAPRAVPAAPAAPQPPRAMAMTTDRVVAIGVSTGGVQSTEAVLRGLDRSAPGIVIVQHMPEKFTASYAARLNSVCQLDVAEARDGDRVHGGRVLIAPGGRHMRLARSGAQYVVEVRDGPQVNHHRPSVDVLFRSVAQHAGRNAVGIVMTGMGDDGARGLREMKAAGARTAAQDEATSVVFGMPAEAIKLGAADAVLPLHDIAAWITQAAQPLR
jgi:two-component system chemotaxis response regulator CheB